MNLFLFVGLLFLGVFLLGQFVEKLKVPWIFSALLIGAVMSLNNPCPDITNSTVFEFFGQLGMYFLLFIIGLEIDLKEMRKRGKFIVKSSLVIILFATVSGAIMINYLFGYDWLISSILALSFATVGEAILVPILDEENLVNTKLGQLIIGIGTFDDLFEILTLLMVTILYEGGGTEAITKPMLAIVSLTILLLAFGLLKSQGKYFAFLKIEPVFLFVLFVLFLFMGIGMMADAAPLAALLAGISVANFLPSERLEPVLQSFKTISYGFFAPIFFLSVGLSLNIHYLFQEPLIIFIFVIVSALSKMIGVYVSGKKELKNNKQILIVGIGLSVRFSTSIIILKILLDHKIIGQELYSIIIASSIIFVIVIPLLFANLASKWSADIR